MNRRVFISFLLGAWTPLAYGIAPIEAAPAVAPKKMAHKAVRSKKPNKQLTEDQAIEAVAKLPEVKKWSKLLASTKGAGNPGYMADKDGSKWTVQVFESKSDHNVTFGFYDVDANTGVVKKEGF